MNRTLAILAVILSLVPAVTGCSGGSKSYAIKINNEEISQAEFMGRLQGVTAVELSPSLQNRGLGRAGDYAVQNLITTHIIEQLAKEKNAVPTDAEIASYVALAKKYQTTQFAQLLLMPYDPFRRDEDWTREARSAVSFFKMWLQLVNVTPEELQKAYDQLKPGLKERDQYHLRVIDSLTEAKANEAVAMLNKKMPFQTVAMTKSSDADSAPKEGDIGMRPDNTLPMDLLNAIKNLKPGEYTTKPIKVSLSQSPQAPTTRAAQPHYLLAQVVDKKLGVMPTLDETKQMIQLYAIRQKDPGSFQRLQNLLREFQGKATIDVKLAGYDKLLTNMKQAATATGASAPTAVPPTGGAAPAPR